MSEVNPQQALESVSRAALQQLAGIEARPVGPAGPYPPPGEMLVTVGLAGEWDGHLVVASTRDAAQAVASGMLETRGLGPGDTAVVDALSELANVLAGNLRRALDPRGMIYEMSLPTPERNPLVHGPRPGDEVWSVSFQEGGLDLWVYLVREPAS